MLLISQKHSKMPHTKCADPFNSQACAKGDGTYIRSYNCIKYIEIRQLDRKNAHSKYLFPKFAQKLLEPLRAPLLKRLLKGVPKKGTNTQVLMFLLEREQLMFLLEREQLIFLIEREQCPDVISKLKKKSL